MRKTKKELEKEFARIRKEIADLEEEETREEIYPRLEKLVGTCWAYRRNSYSCPDKEEDYWDVFKKVLEVFYSEETLYFIVEEFAVDSQGKCSFVVERHWPYPNREEPFPGYVQIKDEEYQRERGAFFKEQETRDKAKARAKD